MVDLTQEAWVSKLQEDANAVILDVRTAREIAEGYIPQALHLDIFKAQEFMEGLERLDKSKNYYVYCRSGNRSGQACNIMKQMGFANAWNLMGGMLEWEGEVVVD